jgi:hypothetical protein
MQAARGAILENRATPVERPPITIKGKGEMVTYVLRPKG